MSGGFIVVQRAMFDHHLVGDMKYFYPWCWMLMQACWKPTKFNIKGKTVVLERGQFCASVRQMADAWGWSKSAVDRLLSRLETETMLTREAGHGRLVITICNYNKYQDVPERKRDNSGTPTGTELGQQRDIKEQGNQETSNHLAPNGACASGDALTPDEIVSEWNELAKELGLAQVRKLTEARKRKLRVRLRENPDLEDWRRAFRHIRDTPFLRGENRNGWRADFDFLLQPSSFIKLTEEAYGAAH